MPTNGLFSRVLKGGTIQLNDSVEVLKEKDKRLRVAILTLSDKGSQGLREDLVDRTSKIILKKEAIMSLLMKYYLTNKL